MVCALRIALFITRLLYRVSLLIIILRYVGRCPESRLYIPSSCDSNIIAGFRLYICIGTTGIILLIPAYCARQLCRRKKQINKAIFPMRLRRYYTLQDNIVFVRSPGIIRFRFGRV